MLDVIMSSTTTKAVPEAQDVLFAPPAMFLRILPSEEDRTDKLRNLYAKTMQMSQDKSSSAPKRLKRKMRLELLMRYREYERSGAREG